jgi:hypothetical protein
MHRIIIEEVTPNAGKKPRVVECYRQEFPALNVLELVARLNAPPKTPRKQAVKKAAAPAAKPVDSGKHQSLDPMGMGHTAAAAIGRP